MRGQAAELAVAGVANKTTWAGALVGFFGWLTSTQGAGLVGLLLAIGGFSVNLYFKRRADRRAEELHAIRIAALRRGLLDDDDPDET